MAIEMRTPRASGREAIEKSVPPDLWKRNYTFRKEIIEMIDDHELKSHPIKALLMQATLNVEITRFMHLEFAHAFAQIFTDSLIHAMATSSQLEPTLGPLGKVSARFLLQLNLLDELGFEPDPQGSEDYYGNPMKSHYIQFSDTLKDLGTTKEYLKAFRPSAAAVKSRATFTENFNDHMKLTLVLAAAETLFTEFASPWAESVKRSTDIDTSRGYHKIHVESDGHFIDDDHSEDSWFLFQQAISPERFGEAKEHLSRWLNAWNDFGTSLMNDVQGMLQKS
jgi:hypothetical protein